MRSARAIPLLLLAFAVAGCGKKGAPLPPLLRIPATVGNATAVRVDNDVFVRFTVPAANVDGETPATIARVEVYAITANRAPTEQDDPEDLRQRSTLVATEQVRRPLPPLPPAKPGEPEPVPPPAGPGVDQGSDVVVHEALAADMQTPITLPELARPVTDETGASAWPAPAVAPAGSGVATRYYYAVGVSPSGRYGPAGAMMPVPLGPTSGPPGRPDVSYDARNITIRWSPSRDARGLGLELIPNALPAKPIVPGPPPTTYDVYEVSNASNQSPPMPTPVNPAPVGALEAQLPVGGFGVERCFIVRSVDIVDGYHVRGPSSPMVCVTPKDTFPPSPPRSLAAVATEGAINLIWEPSESEDVTGYIVLRSRLPDDTLQPAMETPIAATTFVDKGVRAGVTYAFVVIAVDKAGNRSDASNRVEETAR